MRARSGSRNQRLVIVIANPKGCFTPPPIQGYDFQAVVSAVGLLLSSVLNTFIRQYPQDE